MKTIHEKQENKVWDFYLPSRKILNVTGLLMSGAILFSSCLDPHLEMVADIEENFVGITSIEVESGFLPAEYVGNPDLTEVSLDALLRSSGGGSKDISYRVEDEKLIINLDFNGLGWGRSNGHILLTGPTTRSLQMHAGSGEVNAENVTGDRIHMEVNSGRVTAKNLTAPDLNLSASSGQVIAENIKEIPSQRHHPVN